MPREISLAEVVDLGVLRRLASVHTSLSGIVKSYDTSTQTADIQPAIKVPVTSLSTDETEYEQFPIIPNVPIAWPRFGGYVIAGPLSEGDHVLLVFQELATAEYRETGQVSEPTDVRRHDLSYPIAIPCEIADTKPLADHALAANALVIGKDGDTIIVLDSSGVKVGRAAIHFVADATKVDAELTAIATAISGVGGSYVPAVGGVATTKLKSE